MTQTKNIEAGARTQHTPGPWIIEEALTVRGPPNRHYLKSNNTAVAIINGASTANARLIAAAPDLLEAGELLVPTARDLPNGGVEITHEAFMAICDAIKKAR